MRLAIVLGLAIGSLTIGVGAPANAAAMQDARPHHHDRIIIRPTRPAQSGPIPPGWYKFPGYPPIPPEQNRNLDPSNFGGG